MKIAEKILKQAEEFKDDNYVPRKMLSTKVKDQVENYGSRSARILVQEACKIMNNMLNPDHKSPNPASQADMVKLKEAVHMGGEMAKHIKSVKERKRKMGEAKKDLKGFINNLTMSVGNAWEIEDWEDAMYDYLGLEGEEGEEMAQKLRDSFEVILTAAKKKLRADMEREFKKIVGK